MFLNKTLFGVKALIILAFASMSLVFFVPTAHANHGLTRAQCNDETEMNKLYEQEDWTTADQELCRAHADIDAAVDKCIADHPTNTTDQETCINAITPASDGYTGREGSGAPIGIHTAAGTEEECTDGAVGCFGTSSGENKITERLNEIIAFLSVGVGVIITGSVIVAGIQFTFSGGDPQAKAKAIGRLTNAGIAILLYVFGWAFLNWIVPGGWIG